LAPPPKTKSRSLEEAVSYAVGHRVRVEILAILNEGTYSPDQLARMVQQPLSKVTHHIRELLDSRSIEIARVEGVQNRNVSQKFYRAVRTTFMSDEEMAALTREDRQELYGMALQSCMAEGLAALWAGKFADDPRVWLAWCWFNVDSEGREEIADELEASWQRLGNIEAKATSRRAESGEEAVSILVNTLGYERSRKAASTLRDNLKP
jgi:DNA-binding transcriptional ArsR family regulator